MNKPQGKLLAWDGSPEDVTIGNVYTLHDFMGIIRFRDDMGDTRDAGLGEWEEVKMTPVETEGYAEGDLFITLNENYFQKGEVIELEHDDGTTIPLFKSVKNPAEHWYLSLSEVRKVDVGEAQDILRESFKLSDIESGMIVDLRNGDSYLAVANGWGNGSMAFIGKSDAVVIQDYRDDLTSRTDESLDIVEVFGHGGWGCGFNLNMDSEINHLGRDSVWKREDTVTVEGRKVSRKKLEEFLAEYCEP